MRLVTGQDIWMREIGAADAGEPTLIAGLVRVEQSFWAGVAPEDPPIGPDELRLELFQTKARKPNRVWVAIPEHGHPPVGYARLGLPRDVHSTHVEAWVSVAPEFRRRGVGSTLLYRALSAVIPERSLASTWVQRGPGAVLCARLGLTARQEERGSRLDVTKVDGVQQRSWIDDAPARSKGYQVLSWRGPYPEEWLGEICEAADAMRDAPRDGVEHDHAKVTPAMLRDGDQSVRGRFDQFGSLALGPNGEPAGITELGVNLHRPQLGEQGDTCVVAEHRGLQIGRWLKATNLARARAAWPVLHWVRTYNAETNPWMLAINVDQGYRPHTTWVCFQGSTSRALEALRSR